MLTLVRALNRSACRSPYAAVALLAGVTRLVFVLISFTMHQPWLIPDEGQYLGLAASVADGSGAEAWVPGYGQALYDTTRVFMVPLAFMFDVVGETRVVGQLWAAAFGVATAVAAAIVANRLAGRRAAFVAGALVAVLPSQILWSSVVLRESLVWFGLAIIAIGLANSYDESRSDVAAVALLFGGSLALGFLRVQTMLAAAWAIVLVVLLVRRQGHGMRLALAFSVAMLVPLMAGVGLGGYELARDALPNLGAKRTLLSDDAESAFTATTVLREPGSDESDEPSVPADGRDQPDEDDDPDGSQGDRKGAEESVPDDALIDAGDGTQYLVEESLSANLRAIPRGAVATTLRPFPWESSTSTALRIAGLENVAWYALYCLALAGAWWSRRKMEVLAFPVVCAGAILALAFVTQGNLGTAFRHRGQIFWVIAVLSGVALNHLLVRWHERRIVPASEADAQPS